ncbi:MAG: glycosyltransferase family 2 protein [Planctomycetota bacterium]|jgi:glycosyltransferase involved in cell wall biosynthesis
MLDVLLWISAGIWTLLLIHLIANWILVPELAKLELLPPAAWPSVSIVVPARDEEQGIREAVDSFCRQDYANLEVIVVDDQSTDSTPEILEELRAQYANLTVIRGTDPPEGWLGKPNALEIGRRAAKGDWLLFVDADVVYAPDLVRRAMSYALQQDAGMLVVWPEFETTEVLEAVLMSSLHLTVFACIPLFLVPRTRITLLSFGDGVFNLVRRDALHACGAFECLKDAVLDDVGLGYKVKQAGHRITVALAGPLLHIRMYHGARAMMEGFIKNAYPMGRNHPWMLPFAFALGTMLSMIPYVGLLSVFWTGVASTLAIAPIVLMHVVGTGLAIRFHQPWYVAFLMPVREIGWWAIILRSFVAYYRKGIVWRGRRYDKQARLHRE